MSISTLSKYLSSFSNRDLSELEPGLSVFSSMKIKKGDFFVRDGEICTKAAFIVSGILRTFYFDEKGNDTTYCFCGTNKFTTSFKSFISQETSQLSIQALEDSELLVISHEDLYQLYEKYPAWQEIGRKMIESEFIGLEKYSSGLNTDSAKIKYQRLLKEQPEIIQKVPVNYIASYLGVTRETLSRIRKQIA